MEYSTNNSTIIPPTPMNFGYRPVSTGSLSDDSTGTQGVFQEVRKIRPAGISPEDEVTKLESSPSRRYATIPTESKPVDGGELSDDERPSKGPRKKNLEYIPTTTSIPFPVKMRKYRIEHSFDDEVVAPVEKLKHRTHPHIITDRETRSSGSR